MDDKINESKAKAAQIESDRQAAEDRQKADEKTSDAKSKSADAALREDLR